MAVVTGLFRDRESAERAYAGEERPPGLRRFLPPTGEQAEKTAA